MGGRIGGRTGTGVDVGVGTGRDCGSWETLVAMIAQSVLARVSKIIRRVLHVVVDSCADLRPACLRSRTEHLRLMPSERGLGGVRPCALFGNRQDGRRAH